MLTRLKYDDDLNRIKKHYHRMGSNLGTDAIERGSSGGVGGGGGELMNEEMIYDRGRVVINRNNGIFKVECGGVDWSRSGGEGGGGGVSSVVYQLRCGIVIRSCILTG